VHGYIGKEILGLRLSIVVPTKNEAENIEPLLGRIERVMNGTPIEVVFVDDSSDSTPQRIREAGDKFPFNISLIARSLGCQKGGLGGAVVEGLRAAQGQWVCIMDADLQHPPELIPQLLAQAARTGADVVLGSRMAEGGSTESLGRFRRVISRVLAVISQALFPRRLQNVSDPMSGFFLIRREAVDVGRLRPDGFKILVEILIRFPDLRVSEIGFRFGSRHAGRSKAGLREGFRLFRHFLRLCLTDSQRFFVSWA
jgi:dolichol-phosphate mannosyltransferase